MSDSLGKVAVMDQNPGGAVPSESPLAMSRPTVTTVAPAEAGVVISEQAFLGHLVLRGRVTDPAFVAGVEQVLGVAPPSQPLQLASAGEGGVSIQWVSPDEWLIIVPGGQEYVTELKLREVLGGHFAVVNVSGGQTLLSLSGPRAREVLMKCTPYDVHPAHFPVGKAVGTVFAKTTVQLRRTAETRWELVLRRSFADYAYRWLLDAAEEYGVAVA
ncbi:MAG: sarcosine oxidase subunit gamma [Rhodocyclaceae bacterium]